MGSLQLFLEQEGFKANTHALTAEDGESARTHWLVLVGCKDNICTFPLPCARRLPVFHHSVIQKWFQSTCARSDEGRVCLTTFIVVHDAETALSTKHMIPFSMLNHIIGHVVFNSDETMHVSLHEIGEGKNNHTVTILLTHSLTRIELLPHQRTIGNT